MTTFVIATGSAAYNRAKYKPHDKTLVRIARVQHNSAETNVPNDHVVNMINIPAESILLNVATEIIADSNEAGDAFDVGLGAAGKHFGDDIQTDQSDGVVAIPENLDNPWFIKAANVICLTGNGDTVTNGIVQVTATWIELDSFGAAG